MANKFEKIQYLKDLGLNVTEAFLVKKGGNTDQGEKFIMEHNGASIRSFLDQDESILCPHHPNKELKEALLILQELSKTHNVILTERVDLKYALCAGKVMTQTPIDSHRTKLRFELNLAHGAKVRDVDSGKMNYVFDIDALDQMRDDLRKVPQEQGYNPEEINTILLGLHQIYKSVLQTKMTSHIFEVSIYSVPVGVKRENIIFWEVYQSDNMNKV
jgi:hypothetical protein